MPTLDKVGIRLSAVLLISATAFVATPLTSFKVFVTPSKAPLPPPSASPPAPPKLLLGFVELGGVEPLPAGSGVGLGACEEGFAWLGEALSPVVCSCGLVEALSPPPKDDCCVPLSNVDCAGVGGFMVWPGNEPSPSGPTSGSSLAGA